MALASFILADGSTTQLQVDPGVSLMEAARDEGLPGIVAECGGGAICGTCHVIVAPAWFDRLPPPDATERALVEFAPESDPCSRLSCQIIMDDTLDGIEVTVPSEQLQM
jgi:2Fe-2S ferredoxin